MHLAVLAWGNKPYAPGVKVTVDLAEALRNLGVQVTAILVESSEPTAEEVRRRLGQGQVRVGQSLRELPQIVQEVGADVVYAKDHITSLEALSAIKRATGVKTLAFTSGFHSLEALRPRPLTSNAPSEGGPGIRRFLPFTRLTRRYRELLEELNGVVAISYYSEMLLELLYGVRPVGVAYPVVSPQVYSAPPRSSPRRGVVAFLGPAGNRDPQEYLPTLKALPDSAGPIHLFGAADATEAVERALGRDRVQRHVDLSEKDLVKVYGSVRWTYVTPEWEGFGYVGPESLLCGTPVLAEVAQPWMEVAEESSAVRIGRTLKARVSALSDSPPAQQSDLERTRSRLLSQLAPDVVGKKFQGILESL